MYINTTQSKMHVGTCVVDAPVPGAAVDPDAPVPGAAVDPDTSRAQWVSSSSLNDMFWSFDHSNNQKL